MHDLVHDLAQSVVVDECCIMEAEKSTNISKRIRHVSLVANSEQLVTISEALYKVDSLRTLLPRPMCSARFTSKLFSNFLKFGFLLVFVARGSRITKVSSSIGNLKHLRYLDLSSTNIGMLPESICSLWNLQTLKIEGCFYLQRLRKQMRRLKNLRHLYMKFCNSVTQMPPKIGQLTCLKVLSNFIVGEGRGFRLSELQGLNLRGKLRIERLERVKNLKDAKEANLVGKQNLSLLHLDWGRYGESELQQNDEQVLEALEPHPNLEQLFIFGFKVTHFPLWMRNPVLKNVEYIVLSYCKNCLELPPFGKLPSLRALDITGMKYVEYIDNESHGGATRRFPSLETLRILCLPSLKRLSREEGRELLPRLTTFYVADCPKFTLPCLSSLKELRVWSCSELLLSSISNLHSLTSLLVSGNDEVNLLSAGMLRNLTALQSLSIESFTKLECLSEGLQNLTALESLGVYGCPELVALPEGINTSIPFKD